MSKRNLDERVKTSEGTFPKVTKKSKKKKKDSFFDLSGLIPNKLELTINLKDEDKDMVMGKIDEMKDDLIFNWRIVQILMGFAIIASFIAGN